MLFAPHATLFPIPPREGWILSENGRSLHPPPAPSEACIGAAHSASQPSLGCRPVPLLRLRWSRSEDLSESSKSPLRPAPPSESRAGAALSEPRPSAGCRPSPLLRPHRSGDGNLSESDETRPEPIPAVPCPGEALAARQTGICPKAANSRPARRTGWWRSERAQGRTSNRGTTPSHGRVVPGPQRSFR